MNNELNVGDYLCYIDAFGKQLVKVLNVGNWFDFVVVFSDDASEIGMEGTDKQTYHYLFVGDSTMTDEEAINIAKGMK